MTRAQYCHPELYLGGSSDAYRFYQLRKCRTSLHSPLTNRSQGNPTHDAPATWESSPLTKRSQEGINQTRVKNKPSSRSTRTHFVSINDRPRESRSRQAASSSGERRYFDVTGASRDSNSMIQTQTSNDVPTQISTRKKGKEETFKRSEKEHPFKGEWRDQQRQPQNRRMSSSSPRSNDGKTECTYVCRKADLEYPYSFRKTDFKHSCSCQKSCLNSPNILMNDHETYSYLMVVGQKVVPSHSTGKTRGFEGAPPRCSRNFSIDSNRVDVDCYQRNNIDMDIM